MSKSVTIDQSHALMAVLATNVDWEVLDAEFLQKQIIRNPKKAGKQFTAFLRNGGRVIIGEPCIVSIDRTNPFDPVKYLGEGWIIKEQDERSLALLRVDLTMVRFKRVFKATECRGTDKERLRRVKAAGCIRLDAKIFQTLREDQMLIPGEWREEGVIYFDGTTLRHPDGRDVTLCLCWHGDHWDLPGNLDILGDAWRSLGPSAVLAS